MSREGERNAQSGSSLGQCGCHILKALDGGPVAVPSNAAQVRIDQQSLGKHPSPSVPHLVATGDRAQRSRAGKGQGQRQGSPEVQVGQAGVGAQGVNKYGSLHLQPTVNQRETFQCLRERNKMQGRTDRQSQAPLTESSSWISCTKASIT